MLPSLQAATLHNQVHVVYGELNLMLSLPLLSFYRLVGCTYFRAHASGFELTSPVALYHSMTGEQCLRNAACSPLPLHDWRTVLEKCSKWLAIIRRTDWLRAEMDPQKLSNFTGADAYG